MTFTLRHRILLTLLPLLLLLAVVGTAGVVLLLRLGDSATAILRGNYDSVKAMERLNESLERIDSSFQISLSGDETFQGRARRQFDENWEVYLANLRIEQGNITLSGEGELVERLAMMSSRYRAQGEQFYSHPGTTPERNDAYYGNGGLLHSFREIKAVSDKILKINQANMEETSDDARRIARESVIWFGAGLATAIVLAGLLTWHTLRTILRPVQAVTQAALGIGAGNLDQVVPYVAKDELGQLAQAFNGMAHHLRDYKHSQSAQLLRAQQTIQATIDSFPDPVLVIDFEGSVEMANPAARRLLGVVPRQRGQPASGIWQPPEPLRQPLALALEGQADFLPDGFDRALLLGPNGRERTVLPRILTIRDPYGQSLGAAVVLQDVTRLRLLDEIKSNLLATASHELKTPLTSIRLAVHLLLEETVGPLTSKQMELLLDARENSERLLAMINNLLDLGRLEQGSKKLNVRAVSPQSLLQAAAETFRPQADDQGVGIVLDVPQGLAAIAVDASRLGHALRNLLDNALTYTDRGGSITLSAAADRDSVTLSIADTGIGIPPEQVPHVFEKFFRIPGRSRGSGTGLGLAIVHEIVIAMGGTITCESQPGQGTVFRLRIPVATDSSIMEPTAL